MEKLPLIRHNRRRHQPHEFTLPAALPSASPSLIPGLVLGKKCVNWQRENAKRRAKRRSQKKQKYLSSLSSSFSTRESPPPVPMLPVNNHTMIVTFLQESWDLLSADPKVKVYMDPSPSVSAPLVLRLRGGAAPEVLDDTIQAAKCQSLKDNVSAKLIKALSFAAAALRHLRQVWFGMECDGMLGSVHKNDFHTALLSLAGKN